MGRPLHPLGRRRYEAVLRYLARYVFRVAITNNRIVALDANGVTLRHKHRASNRWCTNRLTGYEFIRRFLQHVLPKGCTRSATTGCGIQRGVSTRPRLGFLLLLQCPPSSDLEAPSSRTRGDTADRPDNPTPPSLDFHASEFA